MVAGSSRCALLALLVSGLACAEVPKRAEPPGAMLTVRFETPLGYDQAIARLGEYYQEQIARPLAEALPEVAPHQFYDLWHDTWVSFRLSGDRVEITLRRSVEKSSLHLAKDRMLELAGQVQAPTPVEFHEEPPLHLAVADVFASRQDIARAVEASHAALRSLPSWQHAGLFVSADPLISVVLESSGAGGIRRLEVLTGQAEAASRLLAALLKVTTGPRICTIRSEMAALDDEIRKAAESEEKDLSLRTTTLLYVPEVDLKKIEDRIRNSPQMQKRIAGARNWYTVKYRVNRSAAAVEMRWTELAGYSRADGSFKAEKPVAKIAVRKAPEQSGTLAARVRIDELPQGAYRVRLEGGSGPIDERVFWFDGTIFEEL